jgi:cobalt-zinc-cadmium efflux system outer membrane protein
MFLPTLAVLAVVAPLSLPDLLKDVAEHAPTVSVAEAERDVGSAAVGVAGAWEDPTFSVMSEAIPLGVMEEDAEPTMISYRVGQTLDLFGRRGLAKRAARAEVARADARLRRARWDAQAKAVELFYELWMVDEMARIIDEQIALLDRMRDTALALVRAGMSMGHHDVLRAESEIATMQAEEASLDDERQAIVAMLNTLRGRDAGESIDRVVLPDVRALPAVDVAADAARAAPEVAAARAMKERAAADRELARKMYLPMVMVEAEYEQNLDGMPDGIGIGVTVTIPLWWWDRQRNEVAMARAMERVAAREETAMTAMADAEARMAWSRARAAERSVTALEESAIPKLRETIASIEAAYVAGQGDFIALLDAVMQLEELEMSRVRAVARRGVTRFELNRIAGEEVSP